MILTIAFSELKRLFSTPLAWSLLAMTQLILAYLFLSQINSFTSIQAELASSNSSLGLSDLVLIPLFADAGIVLLFITPLLTMKLISEERANKSLALLLSAPISTLDIIIGKYLSVFLLLMISISLTGLMAMSLCVSTPIDIGILFANIVAISLLSGSFCALGLYLSTLSSQPSIAAISSFLVLLALWVLDLNTGASLQNSELVNYLSLLRHFHLLQTGYINTIDIAYFLLFTGGFLSLSIIQLDSQRL